MKTILRVLVARNWPTDPKARWALIAADGSAIEQGESDPMHWPASDDVEAVLSSDQMVWHRLRVPENLPQGELGRVLANALDEKLIADAESQHVTLTSRKKDEARVLVIARRRLRDIVSRFTALGRPLSAVYSELQVAPSGDRGWHLALLGSSGILRRHSEDGITLDIDEEGRPPQLLIDLAASSVTDGEPLPVLTLHVEEGFASPSLADWEAATGLSTQQGAPYRWYVVGGTSTNLLHGEFLPAHRRLALLSSIRPALWLAGAVLAADLILNAVQVGWDRYRLSEARERIESMFTSAFPSTPAVAPIMQVNKELDRLRSRLGLLRSDDAMTFLGVMSEYLDPSMRDRIERIRYDESSLEITLSRSEGANLVALGRQLETRGLTLTHKIGDSGKAILVIRRKRL